MPIVKREPGFEIVRILLIYVLLLGGIGCTPAEGQTQAFLTQRRINDYSAALEKCRRSLLVSPGLRKQGETLPAYILRIAARLPGEDSAGYLKRENSYIDILQEASDSTASARVVPALKDTSAANVTLWKRAARDLGYLPKRMAQVRSAEGSASVQPAAQHGGPAPALATEMLTTIQLVIDAFSNLRDARP